MRAWLLRNQATQKCLTRYIALIDSMVFNAVFNTISVVSRRPVHLPMLSWSSLKSVLLIIFFPSNWLLSHIIIVEIMDSGERGMNPIVMTIINPRKEYWMRRGSNRQPPVLKFWALPTELWGSGLHYFREKASFAKAWPKKCNLGKCLALECEPCTVKKVT